MSNFEHLISKPLLSKPLVAASSGAAAFASPARATPQASTVFVEVSEQSTAAQITRGGSKLAELEINPEVVGSFLDTLPVVQTKVVTQTILAGTAVARGTVIDVVMVRTDDLPIRVVPGVHTGLADLTVSQVGQEFLGSADVRDILRRRTDSADLTEAEQATLTSALAQQGVQVSGTGNQSLGAAFKGLQAAFTFQG
jgi:hypothetical protein